MTVVLHVSDPHFGTEVPAVVDDLEAFARRLAPDVLVLSGDITQRARRRQFAAARAFVDRLGVAERVVVPGNHDLPLYNVAARVLAPYAGYRRAFAAEHARTVERDDLLVVSLDTTRPWRRIDGELSRAQVERVADRVSRASPGQLRVVVVHQPIAVDRESEVHNLLHGRSRALARWAEAGVDVVAGGHVHLPFVMPAGPAPSGAPWAVQAGTAVSSRTREGIANSLHVWRVGVAAGAGEPGGGPRRLVVERHDHTAGGFRRVAATALAFGTGCVAGSPLSSRLQTAV